MTDYERIIRIAVENNNIFKTKMIVDAGIRKEKIRELLEQGRIKRIGHGFYSLNDTVVDRYYEFQQRCPKGIFSYGTAAYFWGLADKPYTLDCTVPRGYNTSHFNIDTEVKYHYVSQDVYDIGITEFVLPTGVTVRTYDRERIICDFIKNRKKSDMQIFGNALSTYFKSREKDLRRLIKYGKAFHIMDELELYAELLQ